MFVPISHKLINPLSQNPIRPLAILIHNSFPSMEMKYMGKCYYFHKHLHIYGGGCKQAGAWGLFLWLSSFLATLLFGEEDTLAVSSPLGHKGEICSLSARVSASLAYLILQKCLKYIPKRSPKLSGKRRRSLKDNIKQTELREEVKLSRILFSSGLALSFSLIRIFLSIHHDVLKYSSSFFWELFVLLFVNMTEEMCFSKAVC